MSSAGLLTISMLLLISINFLGVDKIALGQFVPLPPPSSSDGGPVKDLFVAPNDKHEPSVEVLTKTMNEGKSVFKVNIKDESGIASAYIKYVNKGEIKTEPLLPRGGELYEALIDMRSPSKIVEIQVVDAAGNTLNTFAAYDVLTSNDIFSRIAEAFTKLWQSFGKGN